MLIYINGLGWHACVVESPAGRNPWLGCPRTLLMLGLLTCTPDKSRKEQEEKKNVLYAHQLVSNVEKYLKDTEKGEEKKLPMLLLQ